ncbi:putative transcriptional regulatory protein [Diplodia seriata]|uniref:Putative transcriptional regulatory protein n=1 Tax=Diplodia seriata TaxID=420778 RepID=A0A1S8B3L6_9PEZI|nr:putative transcriptional regulatory protein [Diplodia seriata]
MATSILQPSTDPELWSLAKEVQNLIKRRVADTAAPSTSKPNTLTQLRDQLPGADICHSLLRTYFSLYEDRLTILHRPTFTPLFSSFIANAPPQTTSAVEPQIYAAMALAAHHLRASSHAHQAAAEAWLRLNPFAAVETWLASLPRRARASLPSLQTRALLVLAQQARGQHVEDHWQATNALVRAAMAAGLHRDPMAFGSSFSAMQADLRRRLWWSVVEMDVAASMDYGMPPALCAEDTDALPGARPDALDLRVALGGGDAAGAVLQDFLARSLQGRLGVAGVVCRTLDQSSRVGLKQLADGVEMAMRDLPPLVDSTVDPTDESVKSAVASLRSLRGTVAISVQRCLSPENMPGVESVRGAADILSSLILLAPGVEEIDAPGPYLSKFIVEFMQDIYKAMTLLSKHLDRGRDAPETTDPSLQAPRLFQLLAESLQVFINNIALEHTSLKSLFALSVSASLAKARSNGEVEKKAVREGLMETLALLQRRFPAATKVRGHRATFIQRFHSLVRSSVRGAARLGHDGRVTRRTHAFGECL